MEVDSLNTSRILNAAAIHREIFDPKNAAHRKSLKKFLDTGNWGGIQFQIEAPFVTVPETVLRKMAHYAVRATRAK